MGPLEFDAGRAQTQGLVDDEIGYEGANPSGGHIGKNHQRVLNRLVDAQLH